MTDQRFGRIQAPDDKHLRRFMLTAETAPTTPTPAVLGVWWRRGWQRDTLVVKGGAYWLPPEQRWGPVEGGHAIAVESPHLKDLVQWHRFYDQIGGSCTGYSGVRVCTNLNRERYNGLMTYRHAQAIDGLIETPPEEGSTVRAAMESLRTIGPYDLTGASHPADGISAYRWPPNVEALAVCLSPEDKGASVLNRGYVNLLNSWGVYYPHKVRMTLEQLRKAVFEQDGEVAVVTDR
jgi:hypothetical protein